MQVLENTRGARTILLVAKFAKKGLLNVSSMAKTLLKRGLVFERVSKLSASEYQIFDDDDNFHGLYNFKCTCGHFHSTDQWDVHEMTLAAHEDCG